MIFTPSCLRDVSVLQDGPAVSQCRGRLIGVLYSDREVMRSTPLSKQNIQRVSSAYGTMQVFEAASAEFPSQYFAVISATEEGC